MKKRIILNLIAIIISFSFAGCTTDEQVENSLGGEWVEVYPQPDRTTVIFSANNTMKLIEEGAGVEEMYTFRIEGDQIFLKQDGSEIETALAFDKLDPMRFNIGYLYPSIPESDPDGFMTFEKI